MASIAGVRIPDNERLEIGLTRIFGVGRHSSQKIIAETGLDPNMRVRDLSDDAVASIRAAITASSIKIEGDLRREIQLNIRRLGDIQTYRGLRHRKRLPLRGQRTKTNARQKRGRPQTVAGRGRAPRH